MFNEIVHVKFHNCSYETAFTVLIYITPPKNNNTVPKNVNVKRGRCPLLFVGDVTVLAHINQVSNGRL